MTAWDDAHARAEARWASMEDAEITLPARLVAEHGREHVALLRWAEQAREVIACRNLVDDVPRFKCGPFVDDEMVSDVPCPVCRLLAALDEIRNTGGHQ